MQFLRGPRLMLLTFHTFECFVFFQTFHNLLYSGWCGQRLLYIERVSVSFLYILTVHRWHKISKISRIVGHRDDCRLEHAIFHVTAIQVEYAYIPLAEIEEVAGVNLFLFLVIVMIIFTLFSVTIVDLAIPQF